MGGYAWVTLATNDSYSLGALVLAHSLKQVGTQQQLAVLVTPGVTDSMREKLNQVFDLVQEVNILDSRDEANLRLLKRPELGITFTKLHCWRLTQFDKCVFLDADTLVLENCDELFEREELSAAPDVGWPDCFNSGVFVYRPSNETYEKLIQFALDRGSFDGGDQGLLNLFFSDWAHKDISKHLPFIYNLCSTACYSYLPAYKQFGRNAKIIHFIGATKPWLQYFDTESRRVHPSGELQHLQDVLQHWWNIFCSLIHPNLTSDMSGLAGAFAQLTLGTPRTAEQAALDDHLRRQGWEVGNIDYLGRDSFENIWSKICETLSGAPEPTPKLKDPSPPITTEDSALEQLPAEVVSQPQPVATETPVVSQTEPTAEVVLQTEAVVPTETAAQPVPQPEAPTPVETIPPTSTPAEAAAPVATAEVVATPPSDVEPTPVTSETPPPVPDSIPSPQVVPVSPQPTSEVPQPAPEVPATTEPAPVVPEASPQPLETIQSSPTPEPSPVAVPPSPQPTTEVPETPAPAVPETPVPAPAVPETPAPPPAVPETPEPAPAIPETPAPAPVVPETPEPAPVAVETPQPVPVAVESPQPTPVATESVKPTPVPETPKSTPIPESPKPVPEVPQSPQPPSSPKTEAAPQVCPITPKPAEKKTAKKSAKEVHVTPKTELTEATPPSTPSTPPAKQPKQPVLSVETSVPDTPPPASSSTATPTPPPRKSSGTPKKTSTKPKK